MYLWYIIGDETNNHIKIKIKFDTVPKHYNIIAPREIRTKRHTLITMKLFGVSD